MLQNTPRNRHVRARGAPRALITLVILMAVIIIVSTPAMLHNPKNSANLENIAGLLRYADVLTLSSFNGIDALLCDYYEAAQYNLDDYIGDEGVRELVITAEKAVVRFTPVAPKGQGGSNAAGVLIEKMARGGLLCQRTTSSVGFSWDPLSRRLEIRLQGGLFEFRLPPLGGSMVEVHARDSMVDGQLVDVGKLRLRLDSSLVNLVGEVSSGAWGGMDLWLKDGFARLFLGGTVRGNATMNLEARSSFLILEPILGWVCLQNVASYNSLLSTNYLPCSSVSGHASSYVQVNLRAWESLVIIPND